MHSKTNPLLVVALMALAVFATLFASTALSSCQSIGPLKQPQEAWVRADRLTYDVIGPRFAQYVQADPALMPVEKKALLDLMIDWRVRVEQAEKAIGGGVLAQHVHDVTLPAGPPGALDDDDAPEVAAR